MVRMILMVLLIAGREGPFSLDLERFREAAGLNGQVRLLGHREDLPEILAAADLFVFPSVYEGLPGAVIEAMALGLPIVASDLPSIGELVEASSNAILVERASPAQLVTAVETLLDDREMALEYGKHSRKIFEARFTLEPSVSRMIALYRRVADSAAKARRSKLKGD